MKQIIRIVCLFLAFIILFPFHVVAAENVDTKSTAPYSSYYFTATSSYLIKTSSQSFQIYYDVTATGMMDELGVSSIQVQKSSDDSNWTTVYTYTKEEYTKLVDADGAYTFDGYINHVGSPGYYYRAIITYYAKKGTGEGYADRYTSSIQL